MKKYVSYLPKLARAQHCKYHPTPECSFSTELNSVSSYIFLGQMKSKIDIFLELDLRSCSWKRQSWVFKPRPLRKDLHSRWEETFLITYIYDDDGHVGGHGGGDVFARFQKGISQNWVSWKGVALSFSSPRFMMMMKVVMHLLESKCAMLSIGCLFLSELENQGTDKAAF